MYSEMMHSLKAPPSSKPRPGRKKHHVQTSQQESSSAILLGTPAASTQQTSTPCESANQPTGRKRAYRPVRPSGFGIMVDEDSGRSVYNPGLRTEKVIEEGTPAEFIHTSNPTTKFPIPNENEIRKSSAAKSSSQDGSRKIDFTSPSSAEPGLAVNPPGLRWKGQPSISSSQLRIQSQQMLTSQTSQQQQQGEQIMTRRMANSSN